MKVSFFQKNILFSRMFFCCQNPNLCYTDNNKTSRTESIAMSKNEIIFKNPAKNSYKVAPLGYSWSVCFLSFLVPLYRRDWKGVLFLLFLEITTLGLGCPIYALRYNTAYARRLLKSGYKIFHIKGVLTSSTYQRITFGINP